MFGRETKRQLREALRIANEALKVVDDTNSHLMKAVVLIEKANNHAEDWRRMYHEATQAKPDAAPPEPILELNLPHCRWVN
jgi:hypothetical protein